MERKFFDNQAVSQLVNSVYESHKNFYVNYGTIEQKEDFYKIYENSVNTFLLYCKMFDLRVYKDNGQSEKIPVIVNLDNYNSIKDFISRLRQDKINQIYIYDGNFKQFNDPNTFYPYPMQNIVRVKY